MKFAFKLLFTVTVLYGLLFQTASAREIYVSSQRGLDTNSGTQTAPYATIQKAADNVQPGDTVVVEKGIYYGPINLTTMGNEASPITFRAESTDEGDVIITNANKVMRENADENLWSIYNEENNIYVADYKVERNVYMKDQSYGFWFPARLLVNDADLLQYPSLDALEDDIYYQDDSQYMPGFAQGYYYDDDAGKLYVRLRRDERFCTSNPNKAIVKVAPSVYTAVSDLGSGYCGNAVGYDSYNFMVGEYVTSPQSERAAAPSYYVNIEGFTFETPGYAGVLLRASDVLISGCFFRGCRTGVQGAALVRSGDKMYSENIIVEKCDYTQFPTFDEAKELIEVYRGNSLLDNDYTIEYEDGATYTLRGFFWWQKKGFNRNFNYEIGGLVNKMGVNWTIRYNNLHDCFDAISNGAMESYCETVMDEEGKKYLYSVGAENIKIYGNTFTKCLDNAIELEQHSKGIEIYDNTFKNNFAHISWQPEHGKPWPTNIKIYDNVIYNNGDFNSFWKNAAGRRCIAFKIGASSINWENEYPWMNGEEMMVIAPEDDGVNIYNNTVVMPQGRLFSNVGVNSLPFENFSFAKNLILSEVIADKKTSVEITGRVASAFDSFNFNDNMFAPDAPGFYSLTDMVLKNGVLLMDGRSIGLKNFTRLAFDYRLKEESPAIGYGKTLVE